MPTPIILDRLRTAAGPKGWIDDPATMAPYLRDWSGRAAGTTPLILRPDTTAGVAAVVSICAEAGIGIVPQGGNTGLVGGGLPGASGDQIVLSTARLNRIRALDPLDDTITVEAGCVLQAIQAAAAEADRLFPLSLGAEGTCQIGGNLSTNAGGILTIRYGNMRDLVLGVEVVLPDGRIWNGLRALRKNNTGYDLKHLFIAGEGTLGIVTAAVLKLFPRPKQVETAFVAVPDPAAGIALLHRLRAATGPALNAFELLPEAALDMAVRYVPGTIDPLAQRHPWYALIEVTAGTPTDSFRETFEGVLGTAIEDGVALDATLAASEQQRRQIWFIREALVQGQEAEGTALRHDVSVPVSAVPRFIAEASAACAAFMPGIRPVPFGHAGDGNIHFNIVRPAALDQAAFMARKGEITQRVHQAVLACGGSISAEHGIGTFKRAELQRTADPVELELMTRIKRALDPQGIMNPGKLL